MSTFSTFIAGAGGAGVSNAGTITSLSNSGTIAGGGGGNGLSGAKGGAGGAGIDNSGAIGALTNSGTIHGGKGGSGSTSGAPGDAILSAGAGASIGPITNSGRIIGNVEIDNQASVTIHGGTGTTFGSWMGGAITIGNGNLIFASGNTEVDENISVNGGVGTVTNSSVLRFAASEMIDGNVINNGTVQVSAGKLEIGGAVTGKGKDTISSSSHLRFDAGVSTATTLGHQNIDLVGHGGTLGLVDPTDFYGKISDFGSSDKVYLEGFWAFSALSHPTHGETLLTLAEGGTKHAFEFAGDYTKSDFHIASGAITTIT